MTSLLTFLPLWQTPADLSTSVPLLVVSISFTLLVFLAGLLVRPLIEKAWPRILPRRDDGPVEEGIIGRDSFRPKGEPENNPASAGPPLPLPTPIVEPKPAPTTIELDYINFEYQYCQQMMHQYEKKEFWIAANQQQLSLFREEYFVRTQFSIENGQKKNILLPDLLKSSSHLVLLGIPGIGKTEFIIYLLLTYARREEKRRLRINQRRLPVFLSARDIVQQVTDSPTFSLAELLHEKLAPPHKAYVPEKLAEGHFLILLDDLNDVGFDRAKQIIDWLEMQIEQAPKNGCIIVARPILQAALGQNSSFTLAHFEPLGDDDLRSLTTKWQAIIPEALNTLTSIIQEEQVYPLAHTPLQLLMLLLVGLVTRTLPTEKTQLYGTYIKLHLAFGDKEKIPPLTLLSHVEKQQILQRVALHLHQNYVLEIDHQTLASLVQDSLIDINDSLDEAGQVFVNFLLRSGLLIKKEGNYRFVHLSFQEFLTAQGQDLTDVNLNQLLEEKADDPWWQEVGYFYEHLTDTTQVIDQAFNQETNDLPNIDKNQAYTLSLLIDNIGSFEALEQEARLMELEEESSAIFNLDQTDLNLEAKADEEDQIKVMVVDDTPQNIQLARFILQRENYNVVEANNAEEALERIQTDKPSLILSDIQMPGMDGYEFCRLLKADPETQHIPFIFVTAFSRSTKEAARGLQIGADDYITRPFAPEELLARIGANVRIHQAEEAARRQATILARRNRELALLNQIQQAVTASLNLDDVLDATMEQVQQVLKAEATSLWFVDRINQALLLSAAFNDSARSIHGIRLPLHEGMSGYVVRSGQPFLSGNIQEHPNFQPIANDRNEQTVHSMIGVPLRVRQQVIGVLQAVHQDLDRFNQDDLNLLNAVGDAVTVAIENAWLFGQIQLFNQQLEQKVEARTHELAQEKEKTETILISIADGLLVTDPNKRIIMANRAAEDLLDFKLSEVMGQSIDQEQFDAPLWRFVRDINAHPERSFTAQTEVSDQERAEGLLAVQANIAKMWDPSEETYTGNVIVLRDVTALQEVDRMKARFMTGITHELKTPIAIMTLHIGSLLKYKSLGEKKKLEMLTTIQRQANLLERLVENILELSRLDGGMQIKREAIDLVALSRQITAELEPLAKKKGLNLDFAPADRVITVDADPSQLERVIRNLVDNAIKYTKEGKITVSLSTNRNAAPEGQAILSVQDTGIGLSKEQLGQLFQRFYRADPSHNIPGTGLGLSIAKEITKKHSGDIDVESTLGQGSRFTVYLPLLQ